MVVYILSVYIRFIVIIIVEEVVVVVVVIIIIILLLLLLLFKIVKCKSGLKIKKKSVFVFDLYQNIIQYISYLNTLLKSTKKS